MDILTPVEARVLGVLIEKEYLTPSAYPLSLKDVTDGCSQKTMRIPVMFVTRTDASEALAALYTMGLVAEVSARRITRYAHNLSELRIPNPAIPIVCALLLYGPSTASEIRVVTAKMYNYPDRSSVEAYLKILWREREEPLVRQVPHREGVREVRWAETLTGVGRAPKPTPTLIELSESVDDLKARIRILEDEILVRST